MGFKGIELSNDHDYRLESLEVGLTSECNFKCAYCCAYRTPGITRMSAEQAIDILRDLPDLKRVKLSGGEVLLRFEDCVKVIDYCSSRGIETQINSNGSTLDARKIQILQSAGLANLHVSLNFANPREFSDYYALSPSIYWKIINTISLVAASEITAIVETMVFDTTTAQLHDVHHCVHGLGVKQHEIQCGVPIQHSGWESLANPHAAKDAIENLILNKWADCELYLSCVPPDIRASLSPALAQADGVFVGECIEGKKQLHLHCNGDVLICELGYPVVLGNVFAGMSLARVISDMPPVLEKFIAEHNCAKMRTPDCTSCKHHPDESIITSSVLASVGEGHRNG